MLEAYPVDKPERSHDDFMFFGSRSLYERAGFRKWCAGRRHGWLCAAGYARGARLKSIEGSAGEDLRLLCCELLLGQHSGCLELPSF